MTYKLSESQQRVVARLAEQGDYPAAYQYVYDALEGPATSGQVNQRVQLWFGIASFVNSDDGNYLSEAVRTYTKNASVLIGSPISDIDFQNASNGLARNVIQNILNNNGEIPDIQEIIRNEVESAVTSLGLHPSAWAGTLISCLLFGYDVTAEAIFSDPSLVADFVRLMAALYTGFTAAFLIDFQNVVQTVEKDIQGLFAAAEVATSPLVVDLSHAGIGLDLTKLETSGTYYDFEGDGFVERTAWIERDTGLLVLDFNGDGAITGNELFGTAGGAASGFAALGLLDTNDDNQITAEDTQFSSLTIWRDVNSNGISESRELVPVELLGITAIDLRTVSMPNQMIQGNSVPLQSTVTFNNGRTATVGDVYFRVDTINTQFVGNYILDLNALVLPSSRGYGSLPVLHVALSLDNYVVDPRSLMALVTNLSSKSLDQIITDGSTSLGQVRDILFRWARVDGIDPTGRGPNVDARELAFLEKMMGQDFLQRGAYSNPYYYAGVDLTHAFHDALNEFYGRLVAQTPAGRTLFVGNPFYNPATDAIEGITGLNLETLGHLQSQAAFVSDLVTFWKNVVRVTSIADAHLSALDSTALDQAIRATDPSLSLSIIESALAFNVATGVTVNGTSAGETLVGSPFNDTLSGGGGRDTLTGGLGNDGLYGGADDDALDGHGGNDLLEGGTGNDTYTYDLGGGQDTINDISGVDRIAFGTGIALPDLTFTRAANGFDLVIDIRTPIGVTGTILIQDQFSLNRIESLVFNDGTTFDPATLRYTVHGTPNADVIEGVAIGGNLDDTIFGEGGDDLIKGGEGKNSLYGGNGHDTLTSGASADILDGGAGDDTLRGGAGDDTYTGGPGNDVMSESISDGGNDTYIYNLGDGNDQISERRTGTGQSDRIVFGDGITAENLRFSRLGNNDVRIDIRNTTGHVGGSITIRTQLNYVGSGGYVEKLTFADGSNLDLGTLNYTVIGTSENDTLEAVRRGGGQNDTMVGLGGADYLNGQEGNDTVDYSLDASRGGAYGVSVDLQAGKGTDGFGGIDTLVSIENVVGTNSLMYRPGNTYADQIIGSSGANKIEALAGNDLLDGGAGKDQLYGGLGNDTYFVRIGDSPRTAPDTIVEQENEGLDTIRFGGGIKTSDLALAVSGSTLTVRYSTGDAITIAGKLDAQSGGLLTHIERYVFDDGTIWDVRSGFPVRGTDAADTINGVDINESIIGLGGSDTLNGLGGKDTLNGGPGDDRLNGGIGSDRYIYGAGADQGSDIICDTGGSADMIELGSGYTATNITLSRVGLNDLAIKNGAQQILLIKNQFTAPSTTIEFLKYGDGTLLNLLSYKHTVNGSAAANTIYGTSYGAGGDILNGLGGADIIYAGTGHDVASGGDGDDTIYGEDGNDILSGDAGNDSINGGLGNDTVKYDGGADVFSDSGGIDTINITTAGIAAANMSLVKPAGTPSKLEVLLNGAHAFDIQGQFSAGQGFEAIKFADGSTFNLTQAKYTTNGTAAGETLYGIGSGGNPDDIINGYGGADTIYGDAGRDMITGGTGNDFLYGDAGNDTYVYNAGDGVDTISDSEGADVIRIGPGYTKADLTWARTNTYDLSLRLKGVFAIKVEGHFNEGHGVESARFADGTTFALNELTIGQNGTTGPDTLNGFSVAYDILNGNAGDDQLSSFGGNDTLIGGLGNDRLEGGLGNDVYVWQAGHGADTVVEEGGTDKIVIGGSTTLESLIFTISGWDLKISSGTMATDSVLVHGQFATASLDGIVETLEFRDGFALSLAGYNEWIKGDSVANTLNGDFGGVSRDDTIVGGAGNDVIRGLNGNDTISGDAGNDTLYGGAGNDALHGGSGNDILHGEAGNDTIFAGLGVDTLSGGANSDRFVYDKATLGIDTITDFSKTEDVLDLSALLTAYNATLEITDFLQITDSGTNSVVKVDLDGVGAVHSWTQIATLNNVVGMTDEKALLSSGRIVV